MEFQNTSSMTELQFGQDLTYKRYPEDNRTYDTQKTGNKSHTKNSQSVTHVGVNLVELASRFQVFPFGPKKSSVNDLSQSSLNISSFPGPNYFHDFNKMKLISPKDDESVTFSSMQIPDENKDNTLITTYCEPKDLKTAVLQSPPVKEVRSKTPSNLHTKRASMGALASTRDLSSSQLMRESTDLGRSFSRNSSPQKNQYSTSTEKFFEGMTERILQKSDEKSKSGSLRKVCESAGNSPTKTNRSKMANSALYSTTKKNPKVASLKSIKLMGSPQIEQKSKTGINLVRNILDDALDEKGQLKARIEELKRLMGEEKATLEKTDENIKFLRNHMGCLAKRNDNLNGSTVNAHASVYKTKEEVQDLKGEVNFLSDRLRRMGKQMEVETELIKLNHQRIKTLRGCLAEESKKRDIVEEQWRASRNERNKTVEKYQEAAKFKKTILETLEDNFKRYAV